MGIPRGRFINTSPILLLVYVSHLGMILKTEFPITLWILLCWQQQNEYLSQNLRELFSQHSFEAVKHYIIMSILLLLHEWLTETEENEIMQLDTRATYYILAVILLMF